jgi:hypothetical protein
MVLCIICWLATEGLAGEAFNYGNAWMKNTKDDRLSWVWDFTNGQEVILEEVKPKKTLKYDITDMEAPVISEVMTEYYKDPGNSYIPWKYMTYIAKMKLKGKSAADIEAQLALLRQYSDYLRTESQKPK